MAVAFIFFIIVIILLILVLGFIFQIYIMVAISSMALVVLGVLILKDGIQGIDTTLTLALGIMFIAIGLYIFINGSLEQLKEFKEG